MGEDEHILKQNLVLTDSIVFSVDTHTHSNSVTSWNVWNSNSYT